MRAGLFSPAVRAAPPFSALCLTFACAASALACAAPDRTALPEGAGAGTLTRDAVPPPGAELVTAPEWRPGESFIMAAGRWARAEFTVVEKSPAGWVLDETGGLRQFFTPEFAIAGQEFPGAPHTALRNEPADPVLDFPLWAGKTWSAEIALRVAGEPEVLLGRVSYACEGWDLLRLPAGELRALRIVRRLTRADEPNGEEQVSLYWWSPDAGFFARKMENGVLLDLEAARRP